MKSSTRTHEIPSSQTRPVHYLPTCTCAACSTERHLCSVLSPSPAPRTVSIPARSAWILGLIPKLTPHGSLARQRRLQQSLV